MATFDPQAAVTYGGFVQLAYDMYKANPDDLTPAPPSDWPAGWTLAAWINAVDHVAWDHVTRFFGFVATNQAEGQIVYAMRGTEGDLEWLIDAEFIPTHFTPVPGSGMVEDGFFSIYASMTAVVNDGASAPATAFRDLLLAPRPQGASVSIIVAGHSLGGPLATMAAFDLAVNSPGSDPTLYALASARPGDGTFVRAVDAAIPNAFLVVNEPDVVPHLPPLYSHLANETEIDSELFPQVKHSLGCYHSLRTYLWVLENDNPFGLDPACAAGTGDTGGTVI